MIFADTHTHLYLDAFDEDRDAIIRRALAVGVEYLFLPNIDRESIAPMLQMTKDYPGVCFAMAGLHPTSVKEDFSETWNLVHQLVPNTQVIAIGECGIDLYWDKSFAPAQEEVFLLHLQWSLETGLPLSVHIRDAFPTVFRLLKGFGNTQFKGVFHCFTGGKEEADLALSYGFHLGIGGVVTFKNTDLQNVVKDIPPTKVVLESDAPFLAPAPYRGKRNEPSYIPLIAEKLATLWNIPLSTVAEITTANACEIFNPVKP